MECVMSEWIVISTRCCGAARCERTADTRQAAEAEAARMRSRGWDSRAERRVKIEEEGEARKEFGRGAATPRFHGDPDTDADEGGDE